MERLSEVGQGKEYRTGSKLAESLNKFWNENENDDDPWDVVGKIFAEKRKCGSDNRQCEK